LCKTQLKLSWAPQQTTHCLKQLALLVCKQAKQLSPCTNCSFFLGFCISIDTVEVCIAYFTLNCRQEAIIAQLSSTET
jgi:hypothetical protein